MHLLHMSATSVAVIEEGVLGQEATGGGALGFLPSSFDSIFLK